MSTLQIRDACTPRPELLSSTLLNSTDNNKQERCRKAAQQYSRYTFYAAEQTPPIRQYYVAEPDGCITRQGKVKRRFEIRK